MADRDPQLGRERARSPGVSWQQLLDEDSNPPPAALREERYEYLGSEPIAASRYTSQDFFDAEVAKMWPNIWQFAARDEEMPEPGDFVVYENAGRSYLVVRQEDGSVRAFHNVCLHRGRKLQTESGFASQFQCPFHGFTWNTDGSLKDIPCRWDFGHLKDERMALPEAEVGRWGGYIFIRENPGGPTLEEYLAPLHKHFAEWRHEECTTAIWVGKVVDANWKVTAEAFMESYHVLVTHPQILPFTGDANCAYSMWGDHVNANWTPFGTVSPHLDAQGRPQQWIVDEFVQFSGRTSDSYDPEADPFNIAVPEGMTARRALGEALRAASTKMYGRDHGKASDAEMIDALVYNVFPNFAPWGGFQPNICYRWRPWPGVDRTLMEVRILIRVPPGKEKPHSVPMHFLGPDEPWSAATELGALGAVLEQDMENIPYVQQGLKASKNGLVNLGDYHEIRIRHFHRTLDKYLAG